MELSVPTMSSDINRLNHSVSSEAEVRLSERWADNELYTRVAHLQQTHIEHTSMHGARGLFQGVVDHGRSLEHLCPDGWGVLTIARWV